MKSYGKPDASWNDARFRGIIEDALGMAKENKKDIAVGQDARGNVVIVEAKRDRPHICACWAFMYKNKKLQDEPELGDHVEYVNYSVEHMIPRVRNALTRGIIGFGGLGFLSEGRVQLNYAVMYARRLVRLHGGQFIVGLADSSITTASQSEREHFTDVQFGKSTSIAVASISERNHFVDYASCVVTKHGSWSLLDRIPDSDAYRTSRKMRMNLNTVHVSDRRSIRIGWEDAFIYDAILEYGKVKRTRQSST